MSSELHPFTFDTNKEVPDGQREDDEDAVSYSERLVSPESAGWLVFQLDYTKLLKRFPPNLDDNVLYEAERPFKIRHK